MPLTGVAVSQLPPSGDSGSHSPSSVSTVKSSEPAPALRTRKTCVVALAPTAQAAFNALVDRDSEGISLNVIVTGTRRGLFVAAADDTVTVAAYVPAVSDVTSNARKTGCASSAHVPLVVTGCTHG